MRVCLLIPYYKDKNKSRQKELDYCLRRNLSNPLISRLVAVCDTQIKIPYHSKLTVVNTGRRQTYNDLFDLGSIMNPDGINMVANADMYFATWDITNICKVDYTDTVLALSRWDVQKKGKPTHHNHKDSQDTWIWKGKLNVNGDYQLGRAGCDNVIAYELSKNYNVINPSYSIKSYHLHLSGVRNYKARNAYKPPFLRVPCCYFNPKKIKKVLHVGLNYKGQTSLNKSLASFGKYTFFDWQKEKDKYGVLGMRARLINVSDKFKPDLVFMQIQTPRIIDAATASALRGFVFNWTGDVRDNIDWLKDLSPYIDATCFTNETDVDTMMEEGLNSRFLQIGFEENIFNPKGLKLSAKQSVHPIPEVIFMGNNYGDKFPLSKERYSIAERIYKTYGSRFLLCGNGWDIPSVNLMGRMKDEAMVYRSCKIAINANHYIHKRFSSDRVFRIMGSGAFCLTRWYPGIEKDFTDGVNIRVFKTLDEMMHLIEYYLQHNDERERIAKAGCELVHNKFKWNIAEIKRICSFPQNKIIDTPVITDKPMSTKEWLKYLYS